MFRLLITFIFFVGIMYYFNIDLRGMVDKSGIPEWLASHNITTKSLTASTTATSTADVVATSTATTTPS